MKASAMADMCPHCGCSLPLSRDAFCPSCHNALDDPPEAVTPRQQQAVRHAGAASAFQVFGWLLIVVAAFDALALRNPVTALLPLIGGGICLEEAYRRYARARAVTRSDKTDEMTKD